jgi:hypothetical protein
MCFHVPAARNHVNQWVDFWLCAGEDIADSGGLRMSFLAWKKQGDRKPEDDRLFFCKFLF